MASTAQRRYAVTKRAIAEFENALPIQRAVVDGIESQLADLRAEASSLELELLTELGDRLVAARRAAGLTQAELAAKIGTVQQVISRYEETRYATVSLHRLQAIAKALSDPGAGS